MKTCVFFIFMNILPEEISSERLQSIKAGSNSRCHRNNDALTCEMNMLLDKKKKTVLPNWFIRKLPTNNSSTLEAPLSLLSLSWTKGSTKRCLSAPKNNQSQINLHVLKKICGNVKTLT